MEKVKNQQGLRVVLFEPQYSGDESENNDQDNFWEMPQNKNKELELNSSGSDNYEEDFLGVNQPN